jgi:hypothetical protein
MVNGELERNWNATVKPSWLPLKNKQIQTKMTQIGEMVTNSMPDCIGESLAR